MNGKNALTEDEDNDGLPDIFFTTGSVHQAHFSNLVAGEVLNGGKSSGLQTALRRGNILFAGIAHGLLSEVAWQKRSAIRFYPDSPRVQIMEWHTLSGKSKLSLDLRRNWSRGVASGQHPEDVFSSQVLRGVAEGTLERVLVDLILAPATKKQVWKSVLSTSSLLEMAQAQKVPTLLLKGNVKNRIEGMPENVALRLQANVQGDCVAVTSARPIKVNDQSRFAWWQVNVRTGETIGVTDEGLHQGSSERAIVAEDLETGEISIIEVEFNADNANFINAAPEILTDNAGYGNIVKGLGGMPITNLLSGAGGVVPLAPL